VCGIAGIWHRNGKPVDLAVLTQMTRTLARRGPDGEGYLIGDAGALGLGHRRLAILDRSERGRQPMGRAGIWISYNGEVYNFLEIRKRLQGLGHEFVSDTDTEVLLAAYQQWGMEAFTQLNGMWAVDSPGSRPLRGRLPRQGAKDNLDSTRFLQLCGKRAAE
jgi:asparagine synthase (glutamine-hydrolysing)